VSRGGTNVCEQTCTSTSGCPNLADECAPLDGGASSCAQVACGPTLDGGAFYSACGAGTCVPYYQADGTQTGLCMAAGNADGGADGGAACGASRGSGPLCPVGTFCYPGSSSNACLPLCDYTAATFGFDAGGPGCGTGQTCVILAENISFGACAETCGGSKGTSCPAGLSCQMWNELTNQSACLP